MFDCKIVVKKLENCLGVSIVQQVKAGKIANDFPNPMSFNGGASERLLDLQNNFIIALDI